MPTRIIILIEINHQITEYVCKNPHLYNSYLSQYNSAKITTNTWVSDAVELDIDVSCQCYTYLLLCFIGLRLKCKTDTKKPEEQYFCYNSTSFTNHRAF